MRRRAAALVTAVLTTAALAAAAHADGGRLRARATIGPLTVSVFTAPEPLAAGPADVSVLVQHAADDTVVHDATVELAVTRPDGTVVAAPATHAAATNQLLYAAALLLVAGTQELAATVRPAGGGAVSVRTALPVAAAPAAGARIARWLLALPGVAAALFALHQLLRAREEARAGARSTAPTLENTSVRATRSPRQA